MDDDKCRLRVSDNLIEVLERDLSLIVTENLDKYTPKFDTFTIWSNRKLLVSIKLWSRTTRMCNPNSNSILLAKI